MMAEWEAWRRGLLRVEWVPFWWIQLLSEGGEDGAL